MMNIVIVYMHDLQAVIVLISVCCRLSLFSLASQLQSHGVMNIHLIVNMHVLRAIVVLISMSAAVT